MTHDSVSEEHQKVAEEIVSIVGTKIAAIYGTYYGSVEMVDAFARSLASREQAAAENAARVIMTELEAQPKATIVQAYYQDKCGQHHGHLVNNAYNMAAKDLIEAARTAAAPFLKGK